MLTFILLSDLVFAVREGLALISISQALSSLSVTIPNYSSIMMSYPYNSNECLFVKMMFWALFRLKIMIFKIWSKVWFTFSRPCLISFTWNLNTFLILQYPIFHLNQDRNYHFFFELPHLLNAFIFIICSSRSHLPYFI